jgi:hypothetical protein
VASRVNLECVVGQVVGKTRRDLFGFVCAQPMFGDQSGQKARIHSSSHIMAGRNRQEGAGIIIESDGVGEPGRLDHLLVVATHAFGAVVKPPGGAVWGGETPGVSGP